MKHTVLVIDNFPVMRRGYAEIIEAEDDLTLADEVGTAQKAIDIMPGLMPDVVILDISLDGEDGFEVVQTIKRRWPQISMLVASDHDETLYAERALRAGAHGYIMKSASEVDLVQAIRRVLSGGFALSEDMQGKVMRQYAQRGFNELLGPPDLLTDREMEVFAHMGHARTTREIADTLGISPKTVVTYRGRIKKKLAIESTTKLMQRASLWVQTTNHGENSEA